MPANNVASEKLKRINAARNHDSKRNYEEMLSPYRYNEMLSQYNETAALKGADGYWQGDDEEDNAVAEVVNVDRAEVERKAFRSLTESAQQVWDNSNAKDTMYDRNKLFDSQKYVTAISLLRKEGAEKVGAQISRMTTFVFQAPN